MIRIQEITPLQKSSSGPKVNGTNVQVKKRKNPYFSPAARIAARRTTDSGIPS